MSKRAKELQEEYLLKHGVVGLVESKSKLKKNRRYYLHQKTKRLCKINSREKSIQFKDEVIINKYIEELVDVFGYIIQLKIK